MRVLFSVIVCTLISFSALVQSDEDRASKLKHEIGHNFKKRNEGRIVDRLQSQGLSQEDSELTSERLYFKFGGCLLDAMLLQAREESIPAEDLLKALESKVFHNGTYQYGDILDWPSVERRAEPCVMSIMSEAGLSFP